MVTFKSSTDIFPNTYTFKKYIFRENECEGGGGVCLENTHIKTRRTPDIHPTLSEYDELKSRIFIIWFHFIMLDWVSSNLFEQMQHNEFNLLLWQDLSMHTAVPQGSFYTDLQRILVKAAYFSGLKSLAVRTMEKWVTCTWHRNTQSLVNDPTRALLVILLSRLQAPNCRNGLDRGLLMWLSSSTDDLLLNLHTRVAFL